MTTKTALITKDFNGLPIVFRGDGYFNATKTAKHFGKRLQDFFDNKDTMKYISALQNLTLIGVSFKEARGGRNGGTWLHPKLAVFFARWLDVRFSVWCDMTIDNILKGNLVVDVAVPTVEALALKEPLEAAKVRILGLEGPPHRGELLPSRSGATV